MNHMDNLFKNIPHVLPEELFETLVESETMRIERIVSMGHSSPGAGWYDQDKNEFVLLLKVPMRQVLSSNSKTAGL